ncbi:hypothetical protein ACIQOV_40265, partial [Kitasatospora sp. NPDC091257]|uniref:hypothetical protein n=1 Tax=Kitasatospora sp. NPDC091257 TaxID=3364084 RepID=UPI003823484C
MMVHDRPSVTRSGRRGCGNRTHGTRTTRARRTADPCGTKGQFTEPKDFSGMLKTHLGVTEEAS